MGRFDLNKAGGFASLTSTAAGHGGRSVANILNTLDLAGRDPQEWDIKEGSYNGVLFHVFESYTNYQAGLAQVQDNGGRRKVKYTFPYVDGQTTDDIGRKPESFEMDILLFGQFYDEALQNLLNEFNKPTPGTLIHPVRGSLNVVVEDFQLIHSNEKRKAVALKVTFAEHNFTIGSIKKRSFGIFEALSGALAVYKEIQKVINQINGAIKFLKLLTGQVAALKAAIKLYQDLFTRALTGINQAFNTKGSGKFPNLLPVGQGGSSTPGSTGTALVAASPNDPFRNVPIAQLSAQAAAALAASQITKDVNAARAQLSVVIAQIEALAAKKGSLVFYDNILALKNSGVLLQKALEAGIASSRAKLVNYIVPRTMSIREVAFANKVPMSRVVDLVVLNPQIECYNMIDPQTVVQVPV